MGIIIIPTDELIFFQRAGEKPPTARAVHTGHIATTVSGGGVPARKGLHRGGRYRGFWDPKKNDQLVEKTRKTLVYDTYIYILIISHNILYHLISSYLITIANGVYKPTNITGGAPLCTSGGFIVATVIVCPNFWYKAWIVLAYAQLSTK